MDSNGSPLDLATGMPPVVGPDLSTGIVNLPAPASERSPYAGELHRGYIQSWNFTLERQLPSNVLASIAYVGTQTVHQFADLDINAGYPGSGSAGLPYAAKFGRTQPTNMWDGYSELSLPLPADLDPKAVLERPHAPGRLYLVKGNQHDRR